MNPSRPDTTRILLLLEATLGGTGRHIVDLAAGLCERGLEVHLVVSSVRSDGPFRSSVLQLKSRFPAMRIESLPIRREVGVKDLYWLWWLFRYSREHGPFDVVHCHSTKAGFLGRLVWLLRPRVRVIYTPHSFMMLNPSVKGVRLALVTALERILARFTDAIAVISEFERSVAEKAGIPARKLILVPNGLTPDDFQEKSIEGIQTRRRLGISEDIVVVGLVGRLCEDKDPELAVRAFAHARRVSTKECKLIVIGTGELADRLRILAGELNIEEDVIWPGEVDGPGFMPALDVLLHSSRFEGLSYVFLEALAVGTPIVSTRVGGAEELIIARNTGLVARDRTQENLGECLCKLIDDAEARDAMSKRAVDLARQYRVEYMVEKLLRLYSGEQTSAHGGKTPALLETK